MQALASPVRHQIVAAFERLGRCSIKELATHVQRLPESLYYHVGVLRKVGLVRECGQRATRRRDETLYELVSREIEVDTHGKSRGFRDAYADMGSALLRHADRQHRRALADPGVRNHGAARERGLLHLNARLDRRTLRRVNEMLLELADFVAANENPAASRQYSILCVLTPVDAGTAPR